MQLVIDIHEKDYQSILNNGQVPYGVVYAIMNGKLLPKGHGDLKDINAIRQKLMIWDYSDPYLDAPKDLCESCYTELENWWNLAPQEESEDAE